MIFVSTFNCSLLDTVEEEGDYDADDESHVSYVEEEAVDEEIEDEEYLEEDDETGT